MSRFSVSGFCVEGEVYQWHTSNFYTNRKTEVSMYSSSIFLRKSNFSYGITFNVTIMVDFRVLSSYLHVHKRQIVVSFTLVYNGLHASNKMIFLEHVFNKYAY